MREHEIMDVTESEDEVFRAMENQQNTQGISQPSGKYKLLGWRLDWPESSAIGSMRWVGADCWARKERMVALGAVAVKLWGDPNKAPSSGPTPWPELDGNQAEVLRLRQILEENNIAYEPYIYYCDHCRCNRNQPSCLKCCNATRLLGIDWEPLRMPPIKRIVELGREVGYAIAIHGSRERDLDMIAVPWGKEAIGNYGLINHIAEGLNGQILAIERKPFGRYACTIKMREGWIKSIDLSVTPQPSHHKDHEIAQLVNKLRDIAKNFHATQQLRARVSNVVHDFLKPKEPKKHPK